MTDSALVTRFQQGDINAFNTLVWRWEKPLLNYIWRQVGDQETAKDLTQTALIRMYKQMKRLKDPDKFSSWAYRIAHNLCLDEFKRRKSRRSQSLDEMTSAQFHSQQLSPHGTDRGPDIIAHQQQVGLILNEALQRIPEEQRVVVVMKQYQGLKFTEIAEILNESVNTVKSRLYYGLKALRSILEASDYSKEVLLHEMS